jgi:hypothetical protein
VSALRVIRTSEVAGIYGGPLGIAYQADRPCDDDDPTSVCIQKDTSGRPDYGQAFHLAELQTAQEWCRLAHPTNDAHGYSGASILMTLWSRPHYEPFGPHPLTTACGSPPEVVVTGKPGPIEVKVDPRSVSILALPSPIPVKRTLVYTLYTGDFRRSVTKQYESYSDQPSVQTGSVIMCVKSTDKLVATVWGWDEFDNPLQNPRLSGGDRVLRGETVVLNGPGFQVTPDTVENRQLDAISS